MTLKRSQVIQAKRIVIKIGSAILTNNGNGLNAPLIASWVEQIGHLKAQGIEVVVVSSGAVAEGVVRQKLSQRPQSLAELQAAAAIGQTGLIQAYQREFDRFALQTAQVLLVHDDVTCPDRYKNAMNTLRVLLDWSAVPIVNENDTVANEELKFGDNDTLAAMVVNIINADLLIILTDQQGMFDSDPRLHKEANLISTFNACDETLLTMAGEGGALGRGGMNTKVKAAQLAACNHAHTVIASGEEQSVLQRVVSGEAIGTLLYSPEEGFEERKAWFNSLRR